MAKQFPYAASSACTTAASNVAPDTTSEQPFGLFLRRGNYLFYLEHLADQARKHGCTIHAWCLITNHVHLLLTPTKPESAGLLIKGLGQRYVQYINRTYGRSGTLWEVRFRILFDAGRKLCTGLLSIHRVEPGQGWGG